MSDRRLVVIEADAAAPNFGAMFALQPNQATGVPLPAFTSGPALPAAGSVIGEAFLDTTSGSGYVWDGNVWQPIAPATVVHYATDTALLADGAQPPGAYGAASDTGNLYVKNPTGWRFVGIKAYSLVTALLGDAAANGVAAIALDEGSVWTRANGAWHCFGIRQMSDKGTIDAWAAEDGSQAIAVDTGVLYARISGKWIAKTAWLDTEVSILASTTQDAGLMAIATDTGRMFVWDGTAWQGMPVRHFTTEAALLADTATPDGVLAWGDDTQVPYTRVAGGWKPIAGGPKISVGAAAPATANDGDLWLDTVYESATRGLNVRHGTEWLSFSSWNLNTAGALLPAPAYDKADPTDAGKPAGMVGLVARYDDGTNKLRLFGKRAGIGYQPITPTVGDSANAGYIVTADQYGYPQFTPPAVELITTVDFKNNIGAGLGGGLEKYKRITASLRWIARSGDNTPFLCFTPNGKGETTNWVQTVSGYGWAGNGFLEQEVNNWAGGNGVFVSLGAWKQNNHVHITVDFVNQDGDWTIVHARCLGIATSGGAQITDQIIKIKEAVAMTGWRITGFTGQQNDCFGTVHGWR